MNESLKKALTAGVFLAWVAAFAVGIVRLEQSFFRVYKALQYTQTLTQELALDSQRILESTHDIRDRSRESEFLQSLVSLMPQNKSFIRTQRAMGDEVEALRYKVGRRVKNDLHILVDTRANKLYVKKGLTLLWDADCSVGRGGILKDKITGRRWEFVTPRGQFEVREKIEKPLWRKPDWAFVEENKPVPPPDDPSRMVEGELGAYVFNLGDGYLIHGTRDEAVLGHPVSHGCVRLGAEDLKRLYETVPKWTRVYIY
jgi:L,D-transpeptidase ErfK/SrfK